MDKDIILKYLELPPYVSYQGVNFKKEIADDTRMSIYVCYQIDSIAGISPHYVDQDGLAWKNPFDDNKSQGFLILREHICDGTDFLRAITEIEQFLETNGLMEKKPAEVNPDSTSLVKNEDILIQYVQGDESVKAVLKKLFPAVIQK